MALIRNLAFGMNILSLVGLALMGMGLALHRHKRIGTPPAFAMMAAGTALTFLGLYIAVP